MTTLRKLQGMSACIPEWWSGCSTPLCSWSEGVRVGWTRKCAIKWARGRPSKDWDSDRQGGQLVWASQDAPLCSLRFGLADCQLMSAVLEEQQDAPHSSGNLRINEGGGDGAQYYALGVKYM